MMLIDDPNEAIRAGKKNNMHSLYFEHCGINMGFWQSGKFLECLSGTSNIAPPWYRIVLPDFVMPVLNFDSLQVNIPNTPLTCPLPYNVLLTLNPLSAVDT